MKEQADKRMHTTEHILNRAMVRMFGCGRCFSAHIEKKEFECDYHFDHNLSLYEIDEIQSRVNRVVKNDLPVTETFVTKEEAGRFYITSKLPHEIDGKIRITHISEYDAWPCSGDHVV